ncbi:MAG: hypothetical protein ACXWC9_09400 [Pseudobdellovibrionaceae bacterium]
MAFHALSLAIFYIALAFPVNAQAGSVLGPFRTDGCSMPFDLFPQSWTDCCTAHDFSYWIGGSLADKQHADAQFVGCLRSKGSTAKLAAKAFELSPEKFSRNYWGGRWTPRRPEGPLTAEELEQVKKHSASFALPFPIVHSSKGHPCSDKILQKMGDLTHLKKNNNLICYDLMGAKYYFGRNEQLIYSDQCNGYFLIQERKQDSGGFSIEGLGDCVKSLRDPRASLRQQIQRHCRLSAPPKRNYLQFLDALDKRQAR